MTSAARVVLFQLWHVQSVFGMALKDTHQTLALFARFWGAVPDQFASMSDGLTPEHARLYE